MGVMTEVAEGELIARCLRSDPDAFRLVYERFAPEVYRFVRRLLPDVDAAEDALQETFIRLHGALAQFDASRALRPYVFGIARNVAIAALRRGDRVRKLEGKGSGPRERPAVPEQAASKEREGLVREALAALEAEHRAVLTLRFTHGLKLREIAEALSCTTRTVRNRLRAAGVLLERELRCRGVVPPEEVAP